MKQCPSCLTTYTDETLRFCLADGSILSALDEEQATLIRTSGIRPAEETAVMGKAEPVRVDLPIAGMPSTRASQPQVPPSSGSSSVVLKIIVAVIGLGILALLLVGAAGAVYYFASGKEVPPATKASDDDVIAFVKATPGGIGYVSAGASTAGVKVIDVK